MHNNENKINCKVNAKEKENQQTSWPRALNGQAEWNVKRA